MWSQAVGHRIVLSLGNRPFQGDQRLIRELPILCGFLSPLLFLVWIFSAHRFASGLGYRRYLWCFLQPFLKLSFTRDIHRAAVTGHAAALWRWRAHTLRLISRLNCAREHLVSARGSIRIQPNRVWENASEVVRTLIASQGNPAQTRIRKRHVLWWYYL